MFGAIGKILGLRADLVVIDDLCNLENTLSPQVRDKIHAWLGEVRLRFVRTTRPALSSENLREALARRMETRWRELAAAGIHHFLAS